MAKRVFTSYNDKKQRGFAMRRVKELKEARNVTQEELAFALGTTQQRVSKLLSGKSNFYPEEIKKCAIFFHVTTDYLLELSDSTEELTIEEATKNNISESQKRLLIYFFGLISEKQRKVIIALLKSMVNED